MAARRCTGRSLSIAASQSGFGPLPRLAICSRRLVAPGEDQKIAPKAPTKLDGAVHGVFGMSGNLLLPNVALGVLRLLLKHLRHAVP